MKWFVLLLLLTGVPGWAADLQVAAPAPDPATHRSVRVCESCLRWEAFKTAREAGDIAAADALIPELLKDGDRNDVTEYLVFDRGRCTEALALLDPERRSYGPKARKSMTPRLCGMTRRDDTRKLRAGLPS
jgi:hypothetical protein